MGPRGRALQKGWDEPIPDAIWPEALISAVRQDVGALASPRVIDTIRTWQSQAQNEKDAATRQLARRQLETLGRAIVGEPATDDLLAAFDPDGLVTALPEDAGVLDESVEDGTIDAFQLPPKPQLRRQVVRAVAEERARARSALSVPRARRVSLEPPPAQEEGDTDAGVRTHHTNTGASAPPEPAFEDDENPTTAFMIPEDRVPPPPPPPPPLPPEALADAVDGLVPPPAAPGPRAQTPSVRDVSAARPPAPPGDAFVFEEDEKPTRHIALPEEVLLRRLDSAEAALVADEPPPAEPERTLMAPYPPKPAGAPPRGPTPKVDIQAEPSSAAPPPPPPPDPPRGAADSHRLAPKPGVIRRSSHGRRNTSTPRPRAAMHHVRTLHVLLHGFVEELMPLAYERRSRRFWARWREVAGDRGVRREVVEELLRTTNDGRTLLCELIAEVQAVDPRSVYTLVDKLSGETPAVAAEPIDSASQPRGPLLGASVRVDPDEG